MVATKRARLAVAAIVAALIVAEFAVPLGSTAYRAEIPLADRWLAQQAKPFVVAEVPLPAPRRVWEFEKRQSEYMLHSTLHWQKTVEGYSGFRSQFHDPASTEPVGPIAREDFMPFLEGRARQFGRYIGTTHGEGFTASRPVGVEDVMGLV